VVLRILVPVIAFIWFGLCGAGPALAHPHIWADTHLTVVFDDAGRVIELKQHWVFDKAFSSWVTQGLDVDGNGAVSPDEEAELAEDNLSGLKEFEYYTFAGEGKGSDAFAPTGNPRMALIEGQNNFWFSLVPESPHTIDKEYDIEVVDPDYYVAFRFPSASSTDLENAPPGCTVTSSAPKPLDDATAKRLAAIGPEQVALPPDLKEAVKDQTNIAVISCPNGSAREGAERTIAPSMFAAKSGTPLAAPPPEGALPMPQTGFLGWVNQQQKTFYAALTGAMGRMKQDGSAFFFLGTLSFLYGVFHAAGPGHGKVVISTYVLANEAELRRGIGLSMAAALVQSLTAIGFVLIAAVALNLTALAMQGAVQVIELGSYGLIALLGLWLIVRRFFGLGHHHGHPPAPAARRRDFWHDNGHDHGHGHPHDPAAAGDVHAHHMVLPTQTHGSWRDALGVILAVGMRPCSGALIVLVFALSQGLLWAGVVAVLLMGLGTGLTVSLLASFAVALRTVAGRMGRGGSGLGGLIVGFFELAGALFLVVFGAVMFLAAFY